MNVTCISVLCAGFIILGCGPKGSETSSGETNDATGETTTTTVGSTSTGSTDTTDTPTEASTTSEPTTDPTTTDPTTTDPTTTTGPTTSPFIQESDMPQPMSECDYYLEGCEEGEKCNVFTPEGDTSVLSYLGCFPLDANPKQVGEPCSTGELPNDGIDNCVEAAVCWNVDDEGNGVCYALCYADPDTEEFGCHGEAASCQLCQDCTVGLCAPYCDPLDIEACYEGEVCIPHNDGYICAPDASNGEGVEGAECEYVNVCNPGFACFGGEDLEGCETFGCCTPFCNVNDPDACPKETESCTSVYNPPPEGYEHVGVCMVP